MLIAEILPVKLGIEHFWVSPVRDEINFLATAQLHVLDKARRIDHDVISAPINEFFQPF